MVYFDEDEKKTRRTIGKTEWVMIKTMFKNSCVLCGKTKRTIKQLERAHPRNTDGTPPETYWSISLLLWYGKPRENYTTGTALSNYYSTANRDYSRYYCWLQATALNNTVPVAVWNNNMATPLWVRRWTNPGTISPLDPQTPVLWKTGSTIISESVRKDRFNLILLR